VHEGALSTGWARPTLVWGARRQHRTTAEKREKMIEKHGKN
jgi:hypothetical protein